MTTSSSSTSTFTSSFCAKRLSRDFKEAVERLPVVLPNARLSLPRGDDISVIHVEIFEVDDHMHRRPHGNRVVVQVEMGSGYPVSPPSVRVIDKTFHHPNVMYGGYVCLDMLRPYSQGAYRGWTPAYTLMSVLMQLSSFLVNDENIDQDYGGYIERKRCYRDPNSFEAIKNAVIARLTDTNTKNTINAASAEEKGGAANPDDEHAVFRSAWRRQRSLTARAMVKYLPLDVIEHVLRFIDPEDRLVLAREEWDNDHLIKSLVFRENMLNETTCPFSKEPPDSETLLVLPVHVQYYRDGGLKSISPSDGYVLNADVFERVGLRSGIWNERVNNNALPVYVNDAHGQRALRALPGYLRSILCHTTRPQMRMNTITEKMTGDGGGHSACRHNDRKEEIVDFFKAVGQTMTSLIVEAVNDDSNTSRTSGKRYLSESAMNTFLHLHHLLVGYATHFTDALSYADELYHEFMRNPHKSRFPNLGIVFVTFLLVPKDVAPWKSLAPVVLRETLARQVYFAQKHPDYGEKRLYDLEEYDLKRTAAHFSASVVSLKIVALQVWFGNALARPAYAATRLEELTRIRKGYNANSGQPSKELQERFYQQFRDVDGMTMWKDFFRTVRMRLMNSPQGGPVRTLADMLRQAVKDSEIYGYHKVSSSAATIWRRPHNNGSDKRQFHTWNPCPIDVVEESGDAYSML